MVKNKEKKIKLSFVNDGKKFVIPHMTVQKQEELLEELADREKKDEDISEKDMQKWMLLKTLQGVDKNVTIDDILSMHPQDFVELVNFIWKKGRELSSDDLNFR